MDLDLSEDEAALAELAATIARREVAPAAAAAWAAGRCPVEVLQRMGEAGLLGLLIPEEWGGGGATTVGFVAAMEQIGRADQSIAAAWQAHSTIGSLPLLRFGTDEQRDRWLRPLAEGRALGAFGLTEPDAGSDASAIRTRAVRRDGGWLINGHKMFISNAGTSMSFGVTLLARLDDDEATGRAQYANFMVEKDTPGFTLGPKLNGIGWKGLDTRELAFDDVWVPDGNLLGSPGRGLSQFLSVLAVGRITVAALSVSLTAAMLEMSTAYARQRRQFGRPLIENQAIAFKLADMATELEASRLLTYRAAALRDAGQPFQHAAAMAKLKASRTAVDSAREAVQIHGGYGYMLDSEVARFYCDAKILEIGEGTSEIQQLVIARGLA
ncbi:MAG TPA: acyl-CoA dehydrogenase family protein [Streptosporangiaceae bacterium]|nr:acyl-CoA dehydrogenase family protein [Streptosporangiaceae bacterium]